jgi:hypothetical protein
MYKNNKNIIALVFIFDTDNANNIIGMVNENKIFRNGLNVSKNALISKFKLITLLNISIKK